MLVLQTLKTTSPSELARVGFWPFWKGPLSQWSSSTFNVEGRIYRNAEQYMMAEKARLFEDRATWNQIMRCDTPARAKELGRQVKGFDEKVWEQHRYQIVVTGNFHKFSQNREHWGWLNLTNNNILVETNPHDEIWSAGFLKNDRRLFIPAEWPGLNLLGLALMEVRRYLYENPVFPTIPPSVA